MAKTLRIAALISGCLSILILVSGCKHKRMRANEISEAGGIIPKEYNFPLDMNELKISTLKLCPRYNFANCSSASVISRDGYVLVAKHSIDGTWTKLKMNIDLKKTVKKQQDRVLVLDLNSWGDEVVTPMVFEFEIVAVGFYDIALLKVKNITTFNKWTVSLEVEYNIPPAGERIFAAGYAKSRYRPEIVEQAFENYRNKHKDIYGEEPTRGIEEFVYPNRKLLLTTGIIEGGDYSVRSSDHKIPWDTPYAGREAIDLIGGMSGGPFLNDRGQIIGIVTNGDYHDRSLKKVDNFRKENFSSFDSGGERLIISTDPSIPKEDNTKTLNFLKKIEDVKNEEVQALRNGVLNKIIDRNKKDSVRVRSHTKKTYSYLKSIRKNKGVIQFPFTLTCKTLGSSQPIKSASSNIKENVYPGHTVSIKSIKYEIVNTDETKIWFKSERLAKGKFFGWFKFNDWSPVYYINTSKLLDGIVHQNGLGKSVNFDGSSIKLKGFVPYLIDKGLWTRELSSPSFKVPNIFVQSLLHDKMPSSDKGERYGEWYWVISECIN